MNDTQLGERLRRAFDNIRADETLIDKTAERLERERRTLASAQAQSAKPAQRRQSHGAHGWNMPKWRAMPRWRVVCLQLAVFVFVCCGGLLYSNFANTAHAFVSIEVNPSVELTINGFGAVIDTYAFDPDGAQLLQTLDVKGKPYSEAVALLWDGMARAGYLGGDALVSTTVKAPHGGEQSLCRHILSALNAKNIENASNARIEVSSISEQTYHDAHACRMGPAKYLAIQELLGVDDTATIEAYAEATIPQIRQRTHQCRMGGARGRGMHGRR